MSTILLSFRFLFGCIIAIAGILTAIFGQALWRNIVYFFTRVGPKPGNKPFRWWLVFFVSAGVTICGAIAQMASTLDFPPRTRVIWIYVTPVGQFLSTPNNEAGAKCFDVGSSITDIAWVSEDMLASSGSVIRIWNITDGTLQRTINPQVGRLKKMAISPDGKRIVTVEATYYSGYVVLYDIENGRKTNEYVGSVLGDPAGKQVNSVLFSPDGKTFAAASNDGGVRVWDSQTGDIIQLLKHARYGEVLSEFVWLIDYSPNSQIIATGSSDNSKHQIHVWNIADGRRLLTLESPNLIRSMAFSPDGTTLAVATIAGPINLYKVVDGSPLATLEGHLSAVNSLSWAPSGNQLASGGSDNTIRLWNPISNNQVLLPTIHSDSVSSVAFSADGRTLASGSDDHKICLWENIPWLQ